MFVIRVISIFQVSVFFSDGKIRILGTQSHSLFQFIEFSSITVGAEPLPVCTFESPKFDFRYLLYNPGGFRKNRWHNFLHGQLAGNGRTDDVIIWKMPKNLFLQIWTYHIPLERKFPADQKSLSEHIPEMKWKRVISHRSRKKGYDVRLFDVISYFQKF